MIHKFGTLK